MPNDRARPHSGVRRERTPGQRSSAMPSRGGGGSCPPPQTTPSLAETAPRRSSRLPLRTQSLDDASLHLMSDYNVASEPTADSASQPDDATHLASSSASQPNAEVRRLALDVIVAINAQWYSLLHDPRLVMERIQLLLSALEAEPEEKLLLESALNVCAPLPAPPVRCVSVRTFVHAYGSNTLSSSTPGSSQARRRPVGGRGGGGRLCQAAPNTATSTTER